MTSPAAAPAESCGAGVANVLLAGVVGSTAYGLAALDDGTFDTVRDNGAVPPSESGQLTLALLRGVEAELATRTEEA